MRKTCAQKIIKNIWTLDSGCPGSPSILVRDECLNDNADGAPGQKPAGAHPALALAATARPREKTSSFANIFPAIAVGPAPIKPRKPAPVNDLTN